LNHVNSLNLLYAKSRGRIASLPGNKKKCLRAWGRISGVKEM
jgi:hypothetical protein